MIQSTTLREAPAAVTRVPDQRVQRSAWPVWAVLTCVVVGGAALRFWNLIPGFPYRIGVDEPVIAERAIHMMKSGDFNPHFFDYPGLYIYVQMLVGCMRFITGSMNGLWRSLEAFHPTDLFLWTRALNAVLGTLTIVVVYRAGLRWGTWVALLAAGLLAVWPNHVRESHFALTDVPLTLLTTLTLVLSLRTIETGRLVWVVGAAACAGFAAATKYSGGVALVMPLIAGAAMNRPVPVRVWGVLAATGVAAATFLLGAPYTLLDLPGFLNGFALLMGHFYPRTFISGAEIYVGHLRVALGWPGLIVASVAVPWCVARAIRDRDAAKWALALIFPLYYFYMFATKSQIYARYVLPVLPFVCLIMAVLIVDVAGWISRLRQPYWVRATAAGAFVSAVLAYPVSEGIAWPIRYGRPITQDVAYKAILKFIPEGSRVVVERSVLRLPDSVYRSTDVRELTQRSRQQYLAAGITYFIASSDAFGQVMAKPAEHADAYQAYQRLFHEQSECLPPIQPTASVPGPQILICRFLPN